MLLCMRNQAALLVLLAVVFTGPVAAGVDVRTELDKTFDFKTVRTWGWNPEGIGEIKMARTQNDDPEAMRKIAEPVIVAAVNAAMERRGLRFTTEAPDVALTYYLLLTTTASSQTLGQFLPGTTQWAVPPFGAATQSLEIMNQGGLLLYANAKGRSVWRGVATGKIEMDVDAAARDRLINEAVGDLLKKFPAKQ